MPNEELDHLADYLFSGSEGVEIARRIDRRVDRLPGLYGLGLLEGSVARAGAVPEEPGLRLAA